MRNFSVLKIGGYTALQTFPTKNNIDFLKHCIVYYIAVFYLLIKLVIFYLQLGNLLESWKVEKENKKWE